MLQRKNQKRVILAIAAVMVLYFFYLETRELFGIEFMSQRETCLTWGEAPFDLEKFKAADGKQNANSIRAQMACSLIRNQGPYIGEDPFKIRELFGNSTGHFRYDAVPTYSIGPKAKGGQDNWQIVFLLDFQHKPSSVSKIVIHKNCCARQNPVISAIINVVFYTIAKTLKLLMSIGL